MKFGVREICEVVLKAKANQKVGNKIFYKNEPVIYFDSLKTSSMEGAATTVYAQGGRGNSRLIAWEGERTITFTMEDALISPAGFMILSGAGLVEANEADEIIVHQTEQTDKVSINEDGNVEITLEQAPAYASITDGDGGSKKLSPSEDYIYVMLLDENGEVASEPFIPASVSGNVVTISKAAVEGLNGRVENAKTPVEDDYYVALGVEAFQGAVVLVDYYVAKKSGAYQVDITPDKFGGNYYLEASTLFRTPNGVDLPAEFIIPNCKIQSNFTFTMASSGDPSTFTFTMDAFPDYTRFDRTKKVLAAIQIIGTTESESDLRRISTRSFDKEDSNYAIYRDTAPVIAG